MPLFRSQGARTDQFQPSHVKVWSAGTGGREGAMAGEPSPSPPALSCGRAGAVLQGTGCLGWGAGGGTGWWTWMCWMKCGGSAMGEVDRY